jgi:hypothetical protein
VGIDSSYFTEPEILVASYDTVAKLNCPAKFLQFMKNLEQEEELVS